MGYLVTENSEAVSRQVDFWLASGGVFMSAGVPDDDGSADSATLRAKRGALLARILYEKDKIIFAEGHPGTDAYVVESGRVGVFKTIDGKPAKWRLLPTHLGRQPPWPLR
jgi:CRP-like cAMP-binding protein